MKMLRAWVCLLLLTMLFGCASQEQEFVYEVGDVIFTHYHGGVAHQIADATRTWTSHVGVVVSTDSGNVIVAESITPISRGESLERFVGGSKDGMFGVRRLVAPLTDEQKVRITAAAKTRYGRPYNAMYDYDDAGSQYCSKFVYEVLKEATGVEVGKIQTFQELKDENPRADEDYWTQRFGGRIPWSQRTITPASLWNSPVLKTVHTYRLPQ